LDGLILSSFSTLRDEGSIVLRTKNENTGIPTKAFPKERI
jgi:hypothetical protein